MRARSTEGEREASEKEQRMERGKLYIYISQIVCVMSQIIVYV